MVFKFYSRYTEVTTGRGGSNENLVFNKMDHEISGQDLILQRSSSLMEDSFSLYSTFTLQDRVVAIEQSGEEFYEKVSKKKSGE